MCYAVCCIISCLIFKCVRCQTHKKKAKSAELEVNKSAPKKKEIIYHNENFEHDCGHAFGLACEHDCGHTSGLACERAREHDCEHVCERACEHACEHVCERACERTTANCLNTLDASRDAYDSEDFFETTHLLDLENVQQTNC